MAATPYPASRAEVFARSLTVRHGVWAHERARERGRRAEAQGNHRQIDFYIAVCTIIADRDRSFSRSRSLG